MKKILTFLLVGLLLLVCIGCSKQVTLSETNENLIYGYWKSGTTYYEFTDTGKWSSFESGYPYILEGSYFIVDDSIVMEVTSHDILSGVPITFENVVIENNDTFSADYFENKESIKATFKRISEEDYNNVKSIIES